MIRAAGAALALLLAGCAGPRLATPQQATLSDLQAVRAALPRPVAVGRFSLGAELPSAQDQAVWVRAVQIRPPAGLTFSRYLGETLSTHLRTAGRLDPTAETVVSGELVENGLVAGFGDGRAVVSADFTVSRGGREAWRGRVRAERGFDSSIIGSVAYLQADTVYAGIFTDLVRALLAEPGFRAAVAH